MPSPFAVPSGSLSDTTGKCISFLGHPLPLPTLPFSFSCDTEANLSQVKAGLQFLCFADIFREILSTTLFPGFVLEIVIEMQQIYRHFWSSIHVFVWNASGKKQYKWHSQEKKNNQLQSFKIIFFFHLTHSASTNYIATIYLHTRNHIFIHLLSFTDKRNGKAVVIMSHSDVINSSFHQIQWCSLQIS